MTFIRRILRGLETAKAARKRKIAIRDGMLRLHDALAGRVLHLVEEETWGVPDGFPLRFELMVLLVSAALHRLQHRPGGATLVQGLWDMTFEGFDHSLRTRGVSDMGMASRMRKLLRGATGRRNAYLAAFENRDEAALRGAIRRNILCKEEGGEADIARLVEQLAPLPEEDALHAL